MGFGSGLQIQNVPPDTHISLSLLSQIATHPVMDSQIPDENVAAGTDVILQASANSATTYASRLHEDEETDTRDTFTSPHHPETIKIRASIVLRECEIYINGFPGLDSKGPNNAFYMRIIGFITGEALPTEENIDRIYYMVMYRNDLARLAMHLLDIANIHRPKGKDIFDFDPDFFEHRMMPVTRSRWLTAWQHFITGLLPLPVRDREESQGPSWRKPRRYIAAAIALDSSIKHEADIESAVERMRNCTYLWLLHSRSYTDDSAKGTRTISGTPSHT